MARSRDLTFLSDFLIVQSQRRFPKLNSDFGMHSKNRCYLFPKSLLSREIDFWKGNILSTSFSDVDNHVRQFLRFQHRFLKKRKDGRVPYFRFLRNRFLKPVSLHQPHRGNAEWKIEKSRSRILSRPVLRDSKIRKTLAADRFSCRKYCRPASALELEPSQFPHSSLTVTSQFPHCDHPCGRHVRVFFRYLFFDCPNSEFCNLKSGIWSKIDPRRDDTNFRNRCWDFGMHSKNRCWNEKSLLKWEIAVELRNRCWKPDGNIPTCVAAYSGAYFWNAF